MQIFSYRTTPNQAHLVHLPKSQTTATSGPCVTSPLVVCHAVIGPLPTYCFHRQTDSRAQNKLLVWCERKQNRPITERRPDGRRLAPVSGGGQPISAPVHFHPRHFSISRPCFLSPLGSSSACRQRHNSGRAQNGKTLPKAVCHLVEWDGANQAGGR